MHISDSVHELLTSKQRVVERFYEKFLSQHPELSHHFQTRDLKMQASIVAMALVNVEGYYTNRFPTVEHYLRVLGHRHYHNGIRNEDFPKFRDVMLETLAEFHGDDWNEQLYSDWKQAIDLSVSVMLEGYSQTYTF